jgi:glycosyltransferase involved in cell wall biosynthesis
VRALLVSAHGADPAYGGAERYVRDLAVGLAGRGADVEVLSAFPQQGEPEVVTHVLHESDRGGQQLRRLRTHLGDIVSAPGPRLRAALPDGRPDLVHTNNLPGIGTGIWEAARSAQIPVVHTLHDYYLFCPRTTLTRPDGSACRPHPLLCGARSRRLVRWQDAVGAVIAVSDHVLRSHRALFPNASKHVVPAPLTRLSGHSQPLKSPPRTVGFLGSLTTTKGVELLLGAAPALARQGLSLRVAGDGPLRPEVEAAQHVLYEGRLDREEVPAFIAGCDVGVVPSLWDEPGAYVVREWLGSGRPVLATPRGGLLESERRGGVLTFDESPAGLEHAAQRLRDPEVWEALLATIPRVEGDADLERWLDEHEAAYDAARERASSPAPG